MRGPLNVLKRLSLRLAAVRADELIDGQVGKSLFQVRLQCYDIARALAHCTDTGPRALCVVFCCVRAELRLPLRLVEHQVDRRVPFRAVVVFYVGYIVAKLNNLLLMSPTINNILSMCFKSSSTK